MSHVYTDEFFDYIDTGARKSAQSLISLVQPWLPVQSVIDFGCGRGVWLDEWRKAGVKDICGLDGEYIELEKLAIPRDAFRPVDLTRHQELDRQFDLAHSFEVGEHLPKSAAEVLVKGLTTHADIVLFSAAVKGQGGEFHINEQPLRYWQELFSRFGYSAFDCVRPALADDRSVEPWYRYNIVLYANDVGQKKLPANVLSTRVMGQLEDAGDFFWSARKSVVRLLPRYIVTATARGRASIIVRRARTR